MRIEELIMVWNLHRCLLLRIFEPEEPFEHERTFISCAPSPSPPGSRVGPIIACVAGASFAGGGGGGKKRKGEERVSMGWCPLRLSAKILALLLLSVNFLQLRLTKKLKINFLLFQKVKY